VGVILVISDSAWEMVVSTVGFVGIPKAANTAPGSGDNGDFSR